MFLKTVIKVVYKFLLPKFIEDCNWLLPESWQIHGGAWALHSLHMSLNNVCTETVCKRLKIKQWAPNPLDLNHLEISCLGSNT